MTKEPNFWGSSVIPVIRGTRIIPKQKEKLLPPSMPKAISEIILHEELQSFSLCSLLVHFFFPHSSVCHIPRRMELHFFSTRSPTPCLPTSLTIFIELLERWIGGHFCHKRCRSMLLASKAPPAHSTEHFVQSAFDGLHASKKLAPHPRAMWACTVIINFSTLLHSVSPEREREKWFLLSLAIQGNQGAKLVHFLGLPSEGVCERETHPRKKEASKKKTWGSRRQILKEARRMCF